MNDDRLLKKLKATQELINAKLNAHISRISERIQTRWEKMPTDTLAKAKRAETRRLLDRGCTLEDVKRHLKNDLNCVVALTAPPDKDPKTEPKIQSWYDAASDTLWQYTDAGDHWTIDMRWMISITNASRYNAIRRYQRKKTFQEAA